MKIAICVELLRINKLHNFNNRLLFYLCIILGYYFNKRNFEACKPFNGKNP
jgi:hypothetical protein